MRVEGFIEKISNKDGTYFVAEIPSLIVITDGETATEAYRMTQDAVGLMLEAHTDGKVNKDNIKIVPLENNKFDVICSDTKALVSLLLKQMRGKAEMALIEVANKSGSKYPNAVRQYETGQSEAGFAKFQELADAMGYDFKITLMQK
jgi:predicted RNase H-like HicB family nuclease